MTPTRTALAFAFALGVLATGCSSEDPATMGDGGGGGGSGGSGSGSNEPPRPLDATGTYTMHSTFDLATNMPGTAGTVVKTIIAATDDKDLDPTLWLIEQLAAQIPDQTARDILNGSKLFVAGYLNNRILDLAPDFLTTMVQVGNDFGTIAKNFGLNETFEISGSGTTYTAVHTVMGVHYTLDNQQGDFSLANYNMPNIVVSGIPVTMDATGQLTIAAHDIPLTYGRLLRLGLDAAILPLIDLSAHSLNDLVLHKVDCSKVGSAIVDAIHVGSSGLFSAACTAGLNAAANFVYSRINAIDGTALRFSVSGTARAVDRNNDRRIDAIQTGTWSGTLAYGTTPTPLLPAAFFGERN